MRAKEKGLNESIREIPKKKKKRRKIQEQQQQKKVPESEKTDK